MADDKMSIQSQQDLATLSTIIRYEQTASVIESAILVEISRLVAERFVQEHYQEIISKIDQRAIANLSVAEAASKIRESLERKIPSKVLIVEKGRNDSF